MKKILTQFATDTTRGAKQTLMCALASVMIGLNTLFPFYCVYFIINAQDLAYKLIGAVFAVTYLYLFGRTNIQLGFKCDKESQ